MNTEKESEFISIAKDIQSMQEERGDTVFYIRIVLEAQLRDIFEEEPGEAKVFLDALFKDGRIDRYTHEWIDNVFRANDKK